MWNKTLHESCRCCGVVQYIHWATVSNCVCVCMRVWRECLLYLGPCLCVFVHSCAPNIFTQRPCSLFPWNRFCHSATAKNLRSRNYYIEKTLFNWTILFLACAPLNDLMMYEYSIRNMIFTLHSRQESFLVSPNSRNIYIELIGKTFGYVWMFNSF